MSQSSVVMPVTGIVSGVTMAGDINSAFDTIRTMFSGASAPSADTPEEGQYWLDTSTTPKTIRLYDGSSWCVVAYLDETGHLYAPMVGGQTATIASAGTTSLGSATAPYAAVTISGTTGITSFGSSARIGQLFFLTFSGALTITYNVTSMILPGAASITTASGATALMQYLGSSNWKMLFYNPNSASPLLAAYTLRGNNTNAAAAEADISISGLTAKTTPVGADLVVISDSAASNAFKKLSLTNLVGTLAVTSIAGNVGAFTLGDDLTNSTNIIKRNISYSQGYLSGLTLSTAGTSATFSVAAGVATDSTAAGMMLLSSALSKTTGNWAVGSATGSFDGTGSSPASNAGWYHVHLIKRVDTGVVDVLTSNSASAPTLPTNYTLFRRIGSMKTNGSFQWIKFTQTGDVFLWDAIVADATTTATNANSARTSLTLTVPTGLTNISALFKGNIFAPSGSQLNFIFSSLLSSDQSAGTLTFADLVIPTGSGTASGNFERIVDSNAQIGWRSSVSGDTFSVGTYGWKDPRGQ